MADYLCEDLLCEIFTRLPPKSLIRFKSLSKSCRRLISSAHFINTHIHQYGKQTPHKLLIKQTNIDSYPAESSFPGETCYRGVIGAKFPRNGCDIVGSCNGIVCLHDGSTQKTTLWNPSIRRTLDLPVRELFCSMGFGFDPISNDYKVVRIRENVTTLEVYTIKTGVWSQITTSVPSYSRVNSFACFFNGALYWVAEGLDNFYLLKLDLGTYVFTKVQLPEPFMRQKRYIPILTVAESLAVCYGNMHTRSIWALREHKNGWCWALVHVSLEPRILVNRAFQKIDKGEFLLITFDGGFIVNLGLEAYMESLALLDEGKPFKQPKILCRITEKKFGISAFQSDIRATSYQSDMRIILQTFSCYSNNTTEVSSSAGCFSDDKSLK